MKIYIENFNSCIPDMHQFCEYVDDYKTADVILLWNDENDLPREICLEAKKLGIPTFVMAHGAYNQQHSETLYAPWDEQRMVADYFLAWSEHDRKLAIKQGINTNNAYLVGCPFFYDFDHEPDGKTVVYFPTHEPGFRHQSMVIWERLRKIPGINPRVKLLITEHDPDDYPGDKVINDRRLDTHIDITYAALENASCMVVDDCGTHILLACHLDIPIIKVKNKYPSYNDYMIETFDIESEVLNILKMTNMKIKRKQVKDFYDRGDCAMNIARVIKEIMSPPPLKVCVVERMSSRDVIR